MFSALNLRTVQGKAIFVVSLIFVVASAVMMVRQGLAERSHALALTTENKKVATHLISSALSGALRFRKEVVFEQTYERLALTSVGDLMMVVAINRSGNIAYSTKNGDVQGLDETSFSGVPLTDKTEAVDEGDYLVVSAPAVYHQAKYSKIVPVGHVLVVWDLSAVKAATWSSMWQSLQLSAAILAVSIILLVVMFRQIVGAPLSRAIAAVLELAQIQGAQEMRGLKKKDEIGRLTLAISVLGDAMTEKALAEAKQTEAERRAEEEKRKFIDELADRFERQVKEVVDGVSSSATEMQATAQQMSATAEETSRQSANVATASEQATANVQTVAATAEELSASISEIGRQVMQSAKIAQNAVERPRRPTRRSRAWRRPRPRSARSWT